MKKQWKGFVAGFVVATLMLSLAGSALAATVTKQLTAYYNNIKISLNGSEVVPKDVKGNPVDPFIVDGTTYLPIRAIASALGLDVDWDGTTKTVVLTSPEYSQESSTDPSAKPSYESASSPTTSDKETLLINQESLTVKYVTIRGKTYQFAFDDGVDTYPLEKLTFSDGTEKLYVNTYIPEPRILDGDKRTDHDSSILAILNLVLGEYEIQSVDNPYLDGKLELNCNDALRNKFNKTIGIKFETSYKSLTEVSSMARYTYNGKSLKEEMLVPGNEFDLYKASWRGYYLLSVQDLLDYFSINKSITIGEHMGYPCYIIQ